MDIHAAWQHGHWQLSTTSPTPQLDARLLLQHVLQVGHSYLVAHGDQKLTADQQQTYFALITRAHNHVPIPYIVGHSNFYGREFIITPAVLIPRPETEQLVATAVTWARHRQPLHIVDVGTGSGCIIVTMALKLPQAHLAAVDISPTALAIAHQNANHYVPNRIHFYEGNLLEPIKSPVDLIIANLPYVTAAEWTMLDDGVKLHEPSMALQGGIDGFDLIRTCLQQAPTKLQNGGAIFLEIGWQQGTEARSIGQSYFPAAQVEVKRDDAGHDRILAIYTG